MWENYNQVTEGDIQNPSYVMRRLIKAGDPELTGWENTTKTLDGVRYNLENRDYLFDYDWKNRKDKSDITKQRGISIEINSFNHAEIACNAGKVDRFYLRS